ncbi:MAG TPA: hypothetical protein VFK14_13340 [Solirubrobacterales bacterium]|nr:hypothetical protein [Solirubrobacterales bacterium]
MKKLKGPELKMPEVKVPAFAQDLYYDLRDRRLLPLVALVAVAIVATPFLLASGSKPEVAPPSAAAGGAGAENASTLTVVRATPGVRDYRRRLRGRSPHDPFAQKFTAPDLSGARLGAGEEGGGGGGSSTSTVETTTSTTVNGTSTVTKETTHSAGGETTRKSETEVNEGGGGQGAQPTGELTFYSFAIDVKVTKTVDKPDGGKETGDPQVRHEVLPPAPLPSKKAQAVTYMGISPTTHKPLLLVSDAVTAVYGEAKCLSGESKCQLLEVETGIPTTFVYGENDVRYKVNILKVTPVTTGHS